VSSLARTRSGDATHDATTEVPFKNTGAQWVRRNAPRSAKLSNARLRCYDVASHRSTFPMNRNHTLIVLGAFGVARPWAGVAGMAKRSGGLRAPAPI
jgi:hypothetical protein